MTGWRTAALAAVALLGGALALVACSGTPSPACDTPDVVLAGEGASALTCAAVDDVVGWVSLIAARPVTGRVRVKAYLLDAYADDPVGTLGWVASVRTAATGLGAERGAAAAEARAHQVWLAAQSRGLIQPSHGDLWNLQRAALSVWAQSDDQELALTEADIEGLIHYASLCREMQRAGTLRLSFADRVPAYQTVSERFTSGSRAERVALTRFGYVWPHARDAWRAASYDRQQAIIAGAPLPQPMTSTSLGYVQAIIEQDLVAAAANLDDGLGPFPVRLP